MCDGISCSRFGKGKDALAITLELTTIDKLFANIALLWWITISPPNFTKLPYTQGLPKVHEDDDLIWLVLQNIYVKDVNNIR